MEKALNLNHLNALQARGIEPEIADRRGIHSETDGRGIDWLVIPFLQHGEIVNNKYRTLGAEKKFRQDKGGKQIFWNEDCLRDDTLVNQPLIITEGEMDALALMQSGFQRVVSVPCGAPDKPIEGDTAKYDFLKFEGEKHLIGPERVGEIIIATDGDQPGANLLHDLALRLGKPRCKYITYPYRSKDDLTRCKDLNEVLMCHGEAGVKKTIERAEWFRLDGVYRLSELPPLPQPMAYEIDMADIRDRWKVRLGDFTVVTGIPSHGKTSFVNDVICRIVYKTGINVTFASFEQSPQRDHKRNLRTWFNRKLVTYQSAEEVAKADEWIDKHFSFIVPSDEDDVTLDWFMERAAASILQHGSRIVVVDPWNEMDHTRDKGESLTEYTGRAIKNFKRFARKFNVHLIVVAHPTKMQKDDGGFFLRPSLYNISDSSHWYNKCDVGIVVHRQQDGSNNTIIDVQKTRYHDEIGTPGEVTALFLSEQRRFEIVEDVSEAA